MPIHRAGSNTFYAGLPSLGQVKKGGQERRLFKPRRVVSTWQENIASRLKPRSEKRWRATRPQPLLGTLLQILMLLDQVKSVVSLPEPSGRLAPPVFAPPAFSDSGNDAGKASALDSQFKPTLHQAAAVGHADRAGEQHLASELSKPEQTLLAGTGFRFPENSAEPTRHVRQAPAPNRRIRHARHRHILSPAPSGAGAMIRSRLEQSAASLLSDYLIARGYPAAGKLSGCAHDAAVLTALHQHLEPAREFVGDPASLKRLDSHALENLMRHVAQKSGFYGARDGQQSAPQFQRQLLIGLVSPWAQDSAPASAACSADPNLPAVKMHETVADIRQAEQNRLHASGLTADVAQWAAGLIQADAEPTLVRADTPGDLRYGSLEWADLQTGIDLAAAAGLDHWAMTYAELIALAQAGDMTVRQHPDAAAELLAPQVRTALIFADMALEADDPDTGRRIEQAMTLLNQARTERWETAQHKLEALEALQLPMPARSLIGANILRDHDLDPDQHIMVQRKRLGVKGEYIEHPDQTMLIRYMGGDRSCSLYGDGDEEQDNKCILPDLDPLFDQAFTQYAAGHRRALAVLFDYAVQALPEQDRTFWQRGKAQILVPQVMNENFVATRAFLMNLHLQTKPFTAIVAIEYRGKTRHYLASTANAEGCLIRFLTGDLPHDASYGRDYAKIVDGALFPHIDDLFMRTGEAKAARQRRWKLVPCGASGRAIPGLTDYFNKAIGKLRDRAYQSTQKQQFEQAVRDGLKSMIPFYDCVSEVREGNAGAAIFSCALDVVSLIPVAGPALKTGMGVGKLVVRFNISALRQLANAAAAGSFRQALSKVAGAQAKLVGRGGKTLAWEALQALDPGVQLFHLTGKGLRSVGKGLRGTGKGLQALLSTLRQAPALQTLADRVTGLLKQKPFRFGAAGVWQMDADAVVRRDGSQFAQIRGQEVETIDLGDLSRVPVVRVADHADARFTLVEPLQGLPYGPQWVMTADGVAALADYRVSLPGPPDPDAGGIIRIGQRDYIQMEGEHYPVRQDADRQSWRIHSENNADGAPISVRYDAGRAQWEVQGAIVPQRSLGDLPDEVHSRIAGHLSGADIRRLSQVDRHWNALLAQERQASQLAEQADSIGSLTQMLGNEGIAGIEDVGMSLRERPLTAFARRIGALPELERQAAFHHLYEAVGLLPWPQRGAPFAALINRLGDLAAGLRQAEYRRIFEEILLLAPQHRAGPLAALAGQVGQLAGDHPVRWNAFNELVRVTLALEAKHRALPLAALAAAISHLPQSIRLNRFDLVFSEIGALPTGQSARPLAALAEQIGVLPEADRQSVFNRILGQIDTLPAQRRAAPFEALTNQVPALPAEGWLESFNRIVRTAAWLDDGGQCAHLTRIAESLIQLQPERRLAAVHSLLHTAGTLDPARGAEQYTQLARRIFELPEHHRQHGFDAVFDATIRLAAKHRAVPLAGLAGNFRWMPDNRHPDEFNRILGQINEIPAERRDVLFDALTRQVGGLPSERLPAIFESLIAAAVAPGAGLHGEPLLRLAKIVENFPENRQTAAFERLIDATGPLDAGVRSEQLMRLARLGQHFPTNGQAAFGSLLHAAGTLDAALRGEHYVQFAWLIDQLPYHQREAFFDDVFRAVLALPEELRAVPLQALTAGIRLLPESRRLGAIRRVGGEMNALSPQTWSTALTALVDQFESLPERQWGMFATLTRASELAAPDNRVALLRMLTERIRLVEPPQDRGRAWRSVLRETAALPPESRATMHVALANRIEAIEWDQDRFTAYSDLLAAIRGLPPQYRTAALIAAADNMPPVPGLERPLMN